MCPKQRKPEKWQVLQGSLRSSTANSLLYWQTECGEAHNVKGSIFSCKHILPPLTEWVSVMSAPSLAD